MGSKLLNERPLIVGMLALIGGVVFPFFAGPYWLRVATLGLYYAILSSSWTLLAGYAGQFSFAHMAFAALGGYTSGLLVARLGLPIVLSMGMGVILAAIAGVLVGALVLRLKGPYLALFTLAMAEIFHLMLVAEQELTRGALGLHVAPLFNTNSGLPYYFLALGILVGSLLIMGAITRSRIGLFLMALREDEDATEACGVDTTRYKIFVFALTSAIAGLAGAFYAHYQGILTPSLVILSQMGLVIAMAVIGGVESLIGAALGGVLIFVLSEWMRTYGDLRFVVLAVALILIERFSQNGIFPLFMQYLARLGWTERWEVDEKGAGSNR